MLFDKHSINDDYYSKGECSIGGHSIQRSVDDGAVCSRSMKTHRWFAQWIPSINWVSCAQALHCIRINYIDRMCDEWATKHKANRQNKNETKQTHKRAHNQMSDALM